MRLESMRWFDNFPEVALAQLGPMGTDVHLLRDGIPSPDLLPFIILVFREEAGDTEPGDTILASQLGDPANARFRAALRNGRVDFMTSFTIRPEHAFTLNATTGVVTPRIPTASEIATAGGKIENFLLRVIATRASDGSEDGLWLRIHLHDQIDAPHVTLSPPTGLTVRAALGDVRTNRFGVLGQFDDGVVGDLSLVPNLTWTLLRRVAGSLVEVPPSANGRSEISENGRVVLSMTPDGVLFAEEDFETEVFVRCGISMRTGERVDTQPAQVFSGGPWVGTGTAPLRVRFIDGAGLANLDSVANVLILPDGFRREDEQIFDELAKRLIADIRRAPSADPYRRFLTNKSINFFSSFLPSREFGCSILHELVPVLSDALCDPLPSTLRPEVTATTIQELLFVVGLPIPADQTLTLDAAITRWGKLFGDAFTTTVPLSALQGPNGLFAQWKKLAVRTLAVEHDTALGMGVGLRPNVRAGSAFGAIGDNPFRARGADLRQRLSTVAVVDDSLGTQIPALWKTPEDTDSGANGKDERLVIVLCAGVTQVGTTNRADHIAAIGLGVTIRPAFTRPFTPPSPAPPDGWRILDVDPGQPSPTPFIPTRGVVLHELSHLVGCGDEYGGGDAEPEPTTVFLTQEFGNIVLDTTLRGPDPNPADPYDMTQSMWGAVARIRAAGVLTQSPVHVGSKFRITLRPHHADAFKSLGLKKGDPLFLRTRPLLRSIIALSQPGQEPVRLPPDFAFALSPQLAFDAFDSSAGSDDALLVTVEDDFLSSTWDVPGPVRYYNPILFAPTLGQDGKPLPLLSPAVAKHIETTNSPMSRRPGTPCAAIVPVRPNPFPAPEPVLNMAASVTNTIGNLLLPKVVGLYDKGGTVECGVYHPTGYCSMNKSSEFFFTLPNPALRTLRVGGTTEFCHVCRYLIIDSIDPTLHAEFDAQYSKFYVETP